MTRGDWSRLEVEATIADYFAMWTDELGGVPVNKAAHNAVLRPLLNSRSPGAIEFKHQNISAVMIQLGLPYIGGYKPRANYQELLRHVVIEQLAANPGLGRLARRSAEASAPAPDAIPDWSAVIVEPPTVEVPLNRADLSTPPRPPRINVDYLEIEAKNRSLGLAGEQFVLELEDRRLRAAGRKELAARIEHVSATRGDGLGYDVLSFELDGAERLIEVKTTRYGQMTPFFVTSNEVHVSSREAHHYRLFRVFSFSRDTRLFMLCGALQDAARLEPSVYRATFR